MRIARIEGLTPFLIKFRAFGGVKEMTYGSADSSVISFGFDNRLRVNTYQSTSSVISGGYVRKAEYEYNPDSRVKEVDNLLDSRFDQAYKYDFAGRITATESGMATNSQQEQVPTYAQTIAYNAFNDITSRGTGVWGASNGFTATYVNGRKQNSDEVYDASGNIVEDPTLNPNIYDKWKFDASGKTVETKSRWYQGAPQQTSFDRTHTVNPYYDGDGRSVKRYENKTQVQVFPSSTYVVETTEYFVRSSVLGGKILTELDSAGAKAITYVYAGDGIIAEQVWSPSTSTGAVSWKHEDVVTGSFNKVRQDGTALGTTDARAAAEFEPLGAVIPQYDPAPIDPPETFDSSYRWGGDIERPELGCAIDGLPLPCNLMPTVVRGLHIRNINVNTRAEGGLDLYHRLRHGNALRRHDVYADDEDDDTTKDSGDVIKVAGSTTYLYSYYELLLPNEPVSDQVAQVPLPPLSDVVEDAKKRLVKKACRDLFGEDVDPVALLEKLANNDRGTGSLGYGAMVVNGKTLNARAYTIAGPTAEQVSVGGQQIWRNTGAMSGAKVVLSNANLTTRFALTALEDRVLTLIHELGHAANLIRNKDGTAGSTASVIQPDDDSTLAGASLLNTNKVLDVCFGNPKDGRLLYQRFAGELN